MIFSTDHPCTSTVLVLASYTLLNNLSFQHPPKATPAARIPETVGYAAHFPAALGLARSQKHVRWVSRFWPIRYRGACIVISKGSECFFSMVLGACRKWLSYSNTNWRTSERGKRSSRKFAHNCGIRPRQWKSCLNYPPSPQNVYWGGRQGIFIHFHPPFLWNTIYCMNFFGKIKKGYLKR